MKKILVILSICMIWQGCDLLIEKPTTALPEEAIFSTEEGLETAMVGCYNAFKGHDLWQGRIAEYLQCGSIITHWRSNRTTDSWWQCLYLTMYSTDTYNQNAFRDAYAGLNVINNFIDMLETSPVDVSYKTELEAEARMLRAVMYFYCTRMWGDLPLVLTSLKTVEDAHLPRTSYLKIYRQILSDLDFAELHMRDQNRQREINGSATRCEKYAATAFKAVVYNQIGCILSSPNDQPFKDQPDFTECGIKDEAAAWTASYECAKKVIDEGPYRLANKFGDLFKWAEQGDWNNDEAIMVCTSSDEAYSVLCMWTLPDYMEGTEHESVYVSSWGRIRPERWVLQKWARTYGGKLATGRGDGFTNVYTSCNDPRFDKTYIHTSYLKQDTGKKLKIYPSDGTVGGIDASVTSSSRIGAPYFRKYLDPKFNGTNSNADWYVLRLAEIYLVAAEACAGLSTAVGDDWWNKSFEYVEEVHKRARRSNDSGPEASAPKWEAGRFASKEELVSALYWERVFELHGELHDWFDMRRRGAKWTIDNLCRPMNEFLQEPEQGPGLGDDVDRDTGYWKTLYHGHVYETDVQRVLKGLLCAFPDDEIRNNSAIDYSDQNPYFVK